MIPSAAFCTRFTNSDNDRKRQVNTLKVFNDNVMEIVENSEYSIEFTAGENKLVMLIILGSDFPMEKPLLRITPSISHQWVNENSEVVTAPGYLNFSVFSDLGRVVHVIIRELQRNPPPLKQFESPVSVLSRSKNSDLMEITPSPEEYKQSFEVMSSVIARLHKMSVEELKALNEDEESLDVFVNDLPHVQSLKQTVTDLINGTEQLDKKSVEYEQNIEKYSSANVEKLREFKEHKTVCKNLRDNYKKLAEIRAPINVKKRLKQTAAALDSESDKIAEKFLEKEITVDQFLTQYKQHRMKFHSVKVKEDRNNQRLLSENFVAP